MKRTILALAIAGLSVAAYALPPPGGGPPTPIDVRVTNSAVPIQSAGTPAQVLLQGKFVNDDINLADTILGPRSFTIPSEFSRFLVRHVSCEVIVATGAKVQIFLDTTFSFTSSTTPGSLVQLIPDNEIFGDLPQPRQVANAEVHAYLGITTPGGPSIGDTLQLNAQRDAKTGTGGVTCVVAGELFK